MKRGCASRVNFRNKKRFKIKNMTIREMIESAPDDARVAILYKNGEDIFDIAELRELLDDIN